MGLIITSTSAATRHGAYIIEKIPPAVIQPTGSGICALVGQFPWGPDQTLYSPSTAADRLNTFAPPGMSRTGSGYLSMIQKAFPLLKIIRVTNAGAKAAATATVTKTGPVNMLTLTLKYVGVAGNSVTWAVSAASDGSANHFNLTISVTGASGTTTDLLQNLNYSGVGANSVIDNTKLQLLGSITFIVAGSPLVASGSFAAGSDGVIVATDYVGTQGTGNLGFAKLEGDKTIRHFTCDDPGVSFRPVVNAGGISHANYMADRMFYVNGVSGQTIAQVQADVVNYQSQNAIYCDPWCNEYDDTTGALQLVPTGSFAMSLGAQLSPSTSIAWKAAEVRAMLRGIISLEVDRGDGASTNTAAGIATFIIEDTGGFTIEAGVTSIAAVNPSLQDDTRSRVEQFIGRAMVNMARPFCDGPNVPDNQQNILDALEIYLGAAKIARSGDANHTFHIYDYSLAEVSGANTPAITAAGDFYVPVSIQTSPAMKRVFFFLNIGPTVTITR